MFARYDELCDKNNRLVPRLTEFNTWNGSSDMHSYFLDKSRVNSPKFL